MILDKGAHRLGVWQGLQSDSWMMSSSWVLNGRRGKQLLPTFYKSINLIYED